MLKSLIDSVITIYYLIFHLNLLSLSNRSRGDLFLFPLSKKIEEYKIVIGPIESYIDDQTDKHVGYITRRKYQPS